MRQAFTAPEHEVRRLWELAFDASYPESLDYKVAFESVFLHKGGDWIINNMETSHENT